MVALATSQGADTNGARTETNMSAYYWTNVTNQAEFAPRDGAGALVFKNRLWLLGGWNPNDQVHFPKVCNSEVWSSVNGKNWKLENPQAPWEGRHCAGYVVHQDHLWIVGGDANQRHYQNDVWRSVDGVKWDNVSTNVPWGPRALHYTVAFAGKIWVMGGQTMPQFASAAERFYSDVWNSADGVKWTKVADDVPWAPRGMMGGSVVFKNRIWILGGGTYDTPKKRDRIFYNDVWSSADGMQWERHTVAAPWNPRQYHDVAVFDGRMWVLEGYNNTGNLKDVWFSADGVNWTEVPKTPWAPRHASSIFVKDGALWVVAGNNMTADVWKLERAKSALPVAPSR